MNEELKHNNEEEVLSNQTEGQQTDEATDDKSASTDTETSAETSTATPELTAEEELGKLKDAHLRLMAEYDNYRKRTLKEKSELILNGGEKVLLALLPVIDDLDIALANMDKAEDLDALREGMKLIHNKFVDYLAKQGVKAIETADAPFNEELHEAIATFPAPTEEQRGRIIDCVKKGYTMGDKVIRHSSVVVGQ